MALKRRNFIILRDFWTIGRKKINAQNMRGYFWAKALLPSGFEPNFLCSVKF